jgi:hypothetical protein
MDNSIQADPQGYNVYRFDDDSDESKQTLIGSRATMDEAIAFAMREGCHQIQRGLDGEVTNLQTRKSPRR